MATITVYVAKERADGMLYIYDKPPAVRKSTEHCNECDQSVKTYEVDGGAPTGELYHLAEFGLHDPKPGEVFAVTFSSYRPKKAKAGKTHARAGKQRRTRKGHRARGKRSRG